MGYSARYHAASLAAVFLAFAVGILIGVGFGSDVVTGTSEDLERSLEADLDDARAEVGELEAELEAERSFGSEIYPAVVEGRLRGLEIAVIGLGGLSNEVLADVEAAIEPSGGRIAEVAVVALPPDLDALGSTLSGREARALSRGDEEALREFGAEAARLLVRGGPRFDRLRGTLLDRYSGETVGIDGALLVRQRPEGLDSGQAATTDALEGGLIEGLRGAAIPTIGIERFDTEPSSIEFFSELGLTTVDSVDRLAGRVALVFALTGAEGAFGVKDTARTLLPDLLRGAPAQSGDAAN